ncbi:MAG: exopolysaccharide biosynthesis polyprenyl glycosylphosphotransferase [Planctomycetota bacterium]
MLRQQHRFFLSVLMAADLMIVFLAVGLAYVLRFELLAGLIPPKGANFDYFTHAIPVELAAPIMMLAMLWAGQYRPRRDQRFYLEAAAIIKGTAVGLGATIVAISLLQNALFGGRHYSGWQFAIYGACTATMLLAWRFSFRFALRRFRARGWNLRHVAIIGTGRLGQLVCHTLRRNTWTGISPVFFIAHQKTKTRDVCLGLPVESGLAELEPTLDAANISGVFIALPARMAAALPDLMARLQRYPLDVRVVPDMNPKYVPINMAANELDGMPVLSVRESPLSGWGQVSKRALDLLGGLALLAIFAVPMMIVGGLVHFHGGGGPVIFRQERMSLNGQRFKIFKFRTMRHADAERQALRDLGKGTEAWTRAGDARVTPIGRFLRRMSLDELPQLFNVVLGEMSLVGPRPERPELIERFREDWRGYMLRQNVKAGITGWAQVNGLRGDTSLRKRIQYDLFYIRNWSLMFDLRILWMTLFRGFAHPHAH